MELDVGTVKRLEVSLQLKRRYASTVRALVSRDITLAHIAKELELVMLRLKKSVPSAEVLDMTISPIDKRKQTGKNS